MEEMWEIEAVREEVLIVNMEWASEIVVGVGRLM